MCKEVKAVDDVMQKSDTMTWYSMKWQSTEK